MKRKKSEQWLEEDDLICPDCDENEEFLPETEKKERKKIQWTKKNITKLVLAIVSGVLVLSLAAGIAVLALRTNDINYKGKYLAGDFWANLTHDQVVATMGEYKLTNGQLQVFLWMQAYNFQQEYYDMYGEYALYYLGLDLEKPLHEQPCDAKPGMTWEQYFIEDALYAWQRYQSAVDEAKKVGYKLPKEYQDMLDESRETLEESAKSSGYASADVMLQEVIGKNVTFEDYYYYQQLYVTSEIYFEELSAKLVFTDKELNDYFKKYAEEYASYGVTQDDSVLVDFRNILVKPIATKDEDGNTVYTEEAWETCKEKAQKILDTWLEGGMNEETFAALAKLKSEDSKTAENGGLNQYVDKNAWAKVDVRHILIMPEGGTKNESGTSITYSEEDWEACRVVAQTVLDEYLAGEKTEKAFGELANKYSDDQNGKVTNGGLYSDVTSGQMVKAFDAWIFDSSRQPGETGLVKTEHGYHVMYFVERNAPVDDWAFAEGRKAEDYTMVKTDEGYQILFYVGNDLKWEIVSLADLTYETTMQMRQTWMDTHPIETKYWAIMLVDRAQAADTK